MQANCATALSDFNGVAFAVVALLIVSMLLLAAHVGHHWNDHDN
jgi:hypothetical protein